MSEPLLELSNVHANSAAKPIGFSISIDGLSDPTLDSILLYLHIGVLTPMCFYNVRYLNNCFQSLSCLAGEAFDTQ